MSKSPAVRTTARQEAGEVLSIGLAYDLPSVVAPKVRWIEFVGKLSTTYYRYIRTRRGEQSVPDPLLPAIGS
jgi:hypothetical protein